MEAGADWQGGGRGAERGRLTGEVHVAWGWGAELHQEGGGGLRPVVYKRLAVLLKRLRGLGPREASDVR